MKKLFLILCFVLTAFVGKAQFLIFLDKGDQFTSPATDMVVMDKYSFAKFHFISEQFDSLKADVGKYDSLIQQEKIFEKELQADYESLLLNKDEQIKDLSASYQQSKSLLEQNIEKQNQLQVDYFKLESKNRRVKRWRNFFMGTSFVFGGIIYLLVR